MNVKRLVTIDMRETTKTLFDNGFTNMYENDVVIDALTRRSKELYTRNQCKAFKLFFPNAEITEVDTHTYIIKSL